MPFRPSLRSIWTLSILAVICLSLYLWCETSRVRRRMPYFDKKIAAATLMDRALHILQETTVQQGVFSPRYKDPRLDAIIGQQFSLITMEFGIFESKLAGANPNMAAVAVDLLARAGIKSGDYVAVGLTGSHPGVNTAVLCACQALGATPVTITAVGASWWGANDPDFTWLDMERLLDDRRLISSLPIAASTGGVNDLAVELSQVGHELIARAAERNKLPLIHESTVGAAVTKRFAYYQKAASGRRYKAYVNVGNGVASLGHVENGRLLHNGLNRRLPIQNYPARGVVHLFAAEGVPVIHFYDVIALSREYGLGGAQVPLPAVGEGAVFVEERYDMRIAGFSAAMAILLVILLVRWDARLFRLRDTGADPDTLM